MPDVPLVAMAAAVGVDGLAGAISGPLSSFVG